MSTISVIIGIIVLLAALVCYAFVTQTINHKREQRKRMLAALKSQYRNFSFVISGCPDGFLTKELKTIVLRSLIEVCDQLAKLEPSDSSHLQTLQQRTKQLADTQREAPSTKRVKLESAQQIKEVKMSLEELHRFVFNLEGQNRVTRAQADTYRGQIKQLVTQVTVDGYILNAQQAGKNGKTKLAIHYFTLAINLLTREGKGGQNNAKIDKLTGIVSELENNLSEEERDEPTSSETNPEEQAELDEAWGKFDDSNEDIWKKKQVYD